MTKSPGVWKYDETYVRDDVKTNLPDSWKVRVFKVLSGDSGNKYYVQVMQGPRNSSPFIPIALCNCNEGTFLAPLAILGLPTGLCKHAKNLLAFLKEVGRL